MQGKHPVQLARERDVRLDQGSAALARHLLAVFRPDLAVFLRAQAGRTAGRVFRLRDDEPHGRPCDLTVFKFLHPNGSVIVATRSELLRAHPEVNPGNLSDLVNGIVKRSKGFQLLGRADSLSTD